MELVSLRMIEMGLAPPPKMEGRYYTQDPVEYIRKSLESLSPEERRKSVRKFRKLHRKATKNKGTPEFNKGKAPTMLQKRSRISNVIRMIVEQVRRENQS